MKKKSGIARSLIMLTQIGITMMVPIFLCVWFGIFLNERLETVYFMPVFLVLGIAAAFRNVYILTKGFYQKEKGEKESDITYVEDLVREGKKKQEETQKSRELGDGKRHNI